MKQKHLLVFPLLALFAASSSPVFAIQKAEPQQKRAVSNFHGVSVSSGIDLYLKQGNSEDVVVKASDDILKSIVTEVKDGVLHIYMKDKHMWRWNEQKAVYVTFKDLSVLDASAGSDVESQGELRFSKLKIQTSSGSDLKLQMDAEEVRLSSSSGSDAELSGKAGLFFVSASSGSDINAGSFEVKECDASASSGSDISLYVTQRLKANASSGSDISYRGNPANKDVNESSGGDVTHQ